MVVIEVGELWAKAHQSSTVESLNPYKVLRGEGPSRYRQPSFRRRRRLL